MKKVQHLLFALILLTGLSTANALTLNFDTPNTHLMVNDNFHVSIFISGSGPAPLSAFDLSLAFDPTMLQFSGYGLGSQLGFPINPDPFDSNNDPADFQADDWTVINHKDGLITLAEASWLGTSGYPDFSQEDSFLLGTLSFKALLDGFTSVELTNSELTFGLFSENPVVFSGMQNSLNLDISPNHTIHTPEPATLTLMITGLAGVGVGVRRRKLKYSKSPKARQK